MTERIDLDDLDVQTDDDEPERNRGDWFWSGEGDPDDEPEEPDYTVDLGESSSTDAVPRVPRDNDDRPVGVPVDSGGAGGNAAKVTNEQQAKAEARYARGEMIDETSDGEGGSDGGSDGADVSSAGDADDRPTAGSANHGGSSDPADMTQAFTFEAVQSLSNLHSALADTQQWADYVGLVGDVDAHVINKFQRENTLDLDFFNGSGTGPHDRLAAIGRNSMFYAERMVVIGLPGEEEYAPDGWEFVPLSEAAEGAGWELDD